jgi:hypothetical protein
MALPAAIAPLTKDPQKVVDPSAGAGAGNFGGNSVGELLAWSSMGQKPDRAPEARGQNWAIGKLSLNRRTVWF